MADTTIIDSVPTQCLACKHLKRAGDLSSGCDAFEAIPTEMIWGGDHRLRLPGDHNVRFEMADTRGAAQAFSNWQSAFAS